MKNNFFFEKVKLSIIFIPTFENIQEYNKYLLENNIEIGLSSEKIKEFLEINILGKKTNFSLPKQDIIRIIKKSITVCDEILDHRNLELIIFSSYNNFIKKKMKGVSGSSFKKNNIVLFIAESENMEETLFETLIHEISHSVVQNYNNWETIEDSLVFEGIAQVYQEKIIRKVPNFSKAITKKEAKKIYKKIKNKLKKSAEEFDKELFYGSGNIPFWAGYSIGYYIIKEFLSTKKVIDWRKLHTISPKIIIEKTDFCDQTTKTFYKS